MRGDRVIGPYRKTRRRRVGGPPARATPRAGRPKGPAWGGPVRLLLEVGSKELGRLGFRFLIHLGIRACRHRERAKHAGYHRSHAALLRDWHGYTATPPIPALGGASRSIAGTAACAPIELNIVLAHLGPREARALSRVRAGSFRGRRRSIGHNLVTSVPLKQRQSGRACNDRGETTCVFREPLRRTAIRG